MPVRDASNWYLTHLQLQSIIKDCNIFKIKATANIRLVEDQRKNIFLTFLANSVIYGYVVEHDNACQQFLIYLQYELSLFT